MLAQRLMWWEKRRKKYGLLAGKMKLNTYNEE
jgi:hypothetical protein